MTCRDLETRNRRNSSHGWTKYTRFSRRRRADWVEGRRVTSNSNFPSPQKSVDQTASTPVMPANVRAGQILGLVEITGGLGGPVDAAKLGDEFGADLVTLLPILDTGELLGLVKVDKGVVSLTDFGHKFQK